MIGTSHIKIGEVTHYYSSLHTAIIGLTGDIHIGDRVMFMGSTKFSQLVTLLQSEHLKIKFAKAGEVVGLLVKQPVSPGDELVKLT